MAYAGPEIESSATEVIGRHHAGDEDPFRDVVDAYRRDLLLHCYRMLGSVHDAEDALQDALLAAWERLGTFEGRSSLRTWLYRVATNRCLDMRRSAQRRSKVYGQLKGFDLPEPSRMGEVLWLQPYPDAYLDNLVDRAPGPDAQYETREAVSLAFIRALQ